MIANIYINIYNITDFRRVKRTNYYITCKIVNVYDIIDFSRAKRANYYIIGKIVEKSCIKNIYQLFAFFFLTNIS